MQKPLVITALVVAAIALAAAALLLGLGALGGPEDPAVAPCRRPPTTLSRARVVGGHRELGVRFTCNGARLAGTLFVPLGRGPHPAVVWLHGSGDQPRLSYGPLVASFVQDGIAFFSYDKRGVGESEGDCCPDETGHFNLVTADAVGAIAALRSSPEIEPRKIGYLGASAAGWIAPRAADSSKAAFLAIASPGVLRHSLVAKYEQFTGGSESSQPRPSEAKIAEQLASWERSGFDPQPYLKRLDIPALWLFGRADRNVPPIQSAALLRALKRERGKDWTIIAYPGAGHGLFDSPPTDPRAIPTAEAWVRHHVNAPGTASRRTQVIRSPRAASTRVG